MTRPHDPRRLALLAAAPATVLLAFQATWPWPFFSDDAFLSLRYAERLASGHGLTWTDGERVEGYSNLLWVLLTAALGALGLDWVDAARLCGAVATTAALYALALALAPADRRTTLLAALPPLLCAATQPVLVWTLGGLEGPLVLALLAFGFGGLARASYREPSPGRWPRELLLRLGTPFALACWTRPDGPIWALCAAAALGGGAARSGGRRAVATAFWFVLPAALAVLAQLLFRIAYYGDFVPNTAHVKIEFRASALGPGFAYVRAAIAATPGLWLTAGIGAGALLLRERARPLAAALLLPVGAWLFYLVAIGGDHFPGRRLLHGALAPLALLAGLGLRALAGNAALSATAVALGLLAAAVDMFVARRDPQSHESRAELWEWRGKVLGEELGRLFAAQRPLLAVDAAGALPFFSRLPALDLLGLSDRTIATTPLPPWLATVRAGVPLPPGHLRGNGRYAMDRAPDLMLFGNPPGLPLPVFVSACEFEDDPRFLDGYRCVLLDLGARELLPGRRESLVAPLWARIDGRAGIERLPDQVVVPAWLFGALRLPGPVQRRYQPPPRDPAERAVIDAHLTAVATWYTQRGAVAVPAAGSLRLRLAAPSATFALRVDAGSWQLAVEPATAAVRIRAPGAVAGDAPPLLVQPAGGEVELELARLGADPVEVDRVVLLRLPH